MVHRISAATRDPSHWGKAYWDFMFVVASTYPHITPSQQELIISNDKFEKIRRRTMCLFQFVARSIPCATCRTHFKQFMKRYPLKNNMGSREQLVRWLWMAKSEVNKRSQKKNTPLKLVCKKLLIT